MSLILVDSAFQVLDDIFTDEVDISPPDTYQGRITRDGLRILSRSLGRGIFITETLTTKISRRAGPPLRASNREFLVRVKGISR
jgi:hypothetical protein